MEKIRRLGEKKVPERRYNANPFSNEKMFDFDSIYKSESDRIRAVNREQANQRGRKEQRGKFAEKVMI